jgi:hypothetical protein
VTVLLSVTAKLCPQIPLCADSARKWYSKRTHRFFSQGAVAGRMAFQRGSDVRMSDPPQPLRSPPPLDPAPRVHGVIIARPSRAISMIFLATSSVRRSRRSVSLSSAGATTRLTNEQGPSARCSGERQMPLPGRVVAAPPGVHGFDASTVLNRRVCEVAKARGFEFCIRYVSRRMCSRWETCPRQRQTSYSVRGWP